MGIANIHVRIWSHIKTLWPSGLRRWLKGPFRKGVGLNPTGAIYAHWQLLASTEHDGHGRTNMLGWRMGHLHWVLQGIKGTRLAAKWEGTFGLG